MALPWDQSHLGPLNLLLKDEGFASAPIRVVLSPTHRRLVRQWPKSSYAALADRLVAEWGAHVLWAWGPGERGFVTEAMGLCKQKTFLCPETTFRELAALFANCDLFVGNSNGPSHVAVAAGLPSFQLHGPTRLRAW